MFQGKLGLSALALELAAWGQLVLGGTSNAELGLYYMSHAGASALLALFAYAFLPSNRNKPRMPILALLFSLTFFVPVLGFIGVVGTILAFPLLPRFAPKLAYREVALPALDPHERVMSGGFRQAGMRGFLNNRQAPVPLRLRALVTLQNVPIRVASPLLRDLLADPTEDLRLLAYGMLDAQEKKLNSSIHDALQSLESAADEAARAASARKLAQLYWELVYQGLVQGDLRRHALQQSLKYTEAALAHQPGDPALQLQLGRLLHETGVGDEARAAYTRALAGGLPATRVLPYMAELAYDARDFAEARRVIGEMRNWQSLPRLQPVVHFWSRSVT